MPNTSSYSLDGKKIKKNRGCYADFLNPYGDRIIQDKAFILIEKKKQEYFGKEKILKYLRDLKDMGFEFTYRTSIIKGDIRIYPTKTIKKNAYNLMLCAAIRYLWEGKYVQTTNDRYYMFVDKYFEIKGKYGFSKLQSLCLAHNIVRLEVGSWMSFNGNHMWCKSGNNFCKLLSKLPTDEPIMNTYCTWELEPKIENLEQLIELWKQ